ncbi:hypothetical protein QLQ86_04925 [Halomonas sp. LR5S13]|uniref:hypothetical protein n=1 Tax=Halomonas rhizosphaerae TaxID=3043296 RepID=UPI0024A82717|nr:hypothetical protein [Halomonas rhizosphaerae]MDI5920129.1 hypothetical protein [Halomonas rhizosphaerae]
MKLMVCSSALIIALLSISPVMAADSVYLEERTKRLHEKTQTSTMEPAMMQKRVGPRTTGARALPAATVASPDPWWH